MTDNLFANRQHVERGQIGYTESLANRDALPPMLDVEEENRTVSYGSPSGVELLAANQGERTSVLGTNVARLAGCSYSVTVQFALSNNTGTPFGCEAIIGHQRAEGDLTGSGIGFGLDLKRERFFVGDPTSPDATADVNGNYRDGRSYLFRVIWDHTKPEFKFVTYGDMDGADDEQVAIIEGTFGNPNSSVDNAARLAGVEYRSGDSSETDLYIGLVGQSWQQP